MGDELLTAADAARLLGITPATVRVHADRGHLPVAQRTTGQMRLFRREDVEKFRQAREIEKRSPHPHSA
jgi:excisionase family DNA binding protein